MQTLLINLVIPFVMILVGLILRKYPVSDMNRHNGYNTPTARKSKEHWDYAQKIAPPHMCENLTCNAIEFERKII